MQFKKHIIKILTIKICFCLQFYWIKRFVLCARVQGWVGFRAMACLPACVQVCRNVNFMFSLLFQSICNSNYSVVAHDISTKVDISKFPLKLQLSIKDDGGIMSNIIETESMLFYLCWKVSHGSVLVIEYKQIFRNPFSNRIMFIILYFFSFSIEAN